MSRKPCSSNREHSHSADSTSASGVALPYLASSRLSSEPALTPILIATPASLAARAISATLSSNCLMLPGFSRTAAQPASIAANTYFCWKAVAGAARGPGLSATGGRPFAVAMGRHRHPDVVAAGAGELGDLRQLRLPFGGGCRGHPSPPHRRSPADRHRTHH